MFWWLVLSAVATLGGWSALARQYPATGKTDGATHRMQSARFGWCDYNGCLNMTISAEGLRIVPLLPFRFGHPPMFLPWEALHVVEVTDRWYGRNVTVAVGEPTIVKVRLPLKVMEDARSIMNGNPMATTSLDQTEKA